MTFYALGVKPLIDKLKECTCKNECKQCWFADDSSAVGKLIKIRAWWQKLHDIGPLYGYYPKPSKSILILKHQYLLPEAERLFAGTGIHISYEGQKHLGAAIGSDDFKAQYVTSKVSKWVQDLENLAKIAKEEPQIALSAYTKGICHR